jgi:hypothetical protein
MKGADEAVRGFQSINRQLSLGGDLLGNQGFKRGLVS